MTIVNFIVKSIEIESLQFEIIFVKMKNKILRHILPLFLLAPPTLSHVPRLINLTFNSSFSCSVSSTLIFSFRSNSRCGVWRSLDPPISSSLQLLHYFNSKSYFLTRSSTIRSLCFDSFTQFLYCHGSFIQIQLLSLYRWREVDDDDTSIN